MRYHYVWLIWSSAFLLPWIALYLTNPLLRTVMWRASLATAVFGLTEPIFVPSTGIRPVSSTWHNGRGLTSKA